MNSETAPALMGNGYKQLGESNWDEHVGILSPYQRKSEAQQAES